MVILKMKMKVGPKGQVVIPKEIRDEKKIMPGDEVFVELGDKGILIEKTEIDVVAEMKKIPNSIGYKGKIDPHAYEEELEEKWRKASRHT